MVALATIPDPSLSLLTRIVSRTTPSRASGDFQRRTSAILQSDEIYQDSSSDTHSDFLVGLQKRVDTLAKAQEVEKSFVDGDVVVNLPVICFDALLPGQRMHGSTTDPTFCEVRLRCVYDNLLRHSLVLKQHLIIIYQMLRSLGLGGSFVMTSLNTKQRKLRRHATIAKIELVDVEPNTDFSPTAVTFMIAGQRRCEILGVANDMKARVGRWRRDYDPDGEETRLGWGEERFVDIENSRLRSDVRILLSRSNDEEGTTSNEWNNNKIFVIDQDKEDENATAAVMDKAASLIPLIEQWYSLASNPDTFENIDVVASTRIQRGQPGLRVDPDALLRRVRMDLGTIPPSTKPTALAVWGAALINPLPALGVSTEVRGAILHVNGAEAKLDVLERGLIRSINNLKGIMPL